MGCVKNELIAHGVESVFVANGNRLIVGYKPIVSVYVKSDGLAIRVNRHCHPTDGRGFELAGPGCVDDVVRYVIGMLVAD